MQKQVDLFGTIPIYLPPLLSWLIAFSKELEPSYAVSLIPVDGVLI